MTTFIPFGSPNGDSKFIQTGVFSEGQEIKVKATGILAGATGSPMIKESAAVQIMPESVVTPTPLGSPRTFLMEDAYSGGYAQAITEANTSNPDSAASITWVLGRGNYFPQTATNGEVITLENELDSQAKADAWAEVWTAWALDILDKKAAAGLTVAGNPICLDPEDKGVDSAVGSADWNFAKTSGSNINAGGYSDSRIGYSGDFTTDISVAMPFVLSALRQVTEAVKAVYPTSPVGWYNAGFLMYLPGWQGADLNTTDGTWAHFENVLSGLVTEDSDYFQHEFLGLCDFGFVPWYQGVAGEVENNLDNGNDNEITSRSWMGHFNDPNKQARALYLVLKYLGPNSVEGSGAAKGDKLIFGLIESYMASDGDAKNLDGGKAIAVRAALSANSGGTFAQVAAGPNTAGVTTPANWVASDLGYTDLSLLRGSSTLLGTDIPNPGDSSSDTSDPGVYNVPYLKEEFLDYMSWLFSADSNNMVNADGDLIEYSACPTDPFRNLTGSPLPSVRLTDTMAHMRMSIFDGDMATEYSYTPSGGGSNDVYYIAGRWDDDDMSALSAARQVQVLYSGYGNHKDYATTVPGQTASDIFPAADKAAWFDVDKKERAMAMINRDVNNFLAAPAPPSGFTATGVTDVADGGSGSKDNNPTVSPSGTGVDALTIRGNNNGTPRIIVRFLNDTGNADRDAFKLAYPEGTPAMLTVEGVEYYSSSVSYSQGTGFLIIPGTDFDSFPDDVSVGDAYTFEISDDITPPSSADMGSMSFTYTGTNQTGAVTYTEATDPSGVTGVFMAQGRYNPADPNTSVFNGQVIIGNTLKLGPGYSDSGSILVDGGIYSTPTYAYTGDNVTKTGEWVSALAPSGISFTVTVDRSGTIFQSTKIIGDYTIDNQGGYVNIQLGSLDNFVSSYQAGDIVTIQCTKL